MRTVEPKIKVSATSPFQAECGNLSSASEKLSKRKLLQSFRTVSPSKKDTKRKGEASKHGYSWYSGPSASHTRMYISNVRVYIYTQACV